MHIRAKPANDAEQGPNGGIPETCTLAAAFVFETELQEGEIRAEPVLISGATALVIDIHSVAAHPTAPISFTNRQPHKGVILRPYGVFSTATSSCDNSSPTGATINPPGLSCS
jgi:hypothetical protein